MTHTLIECAACGWESADHQSPDSAARAGVDHLAHAHPNMAAPRGGQEQVRLYAYLTLAEYLSAHGAEPAEEPPGKNGDDGENGDEESGDEEEPPPGARAVRGPPRRARTLETQDETPRARGRVKKPRRGK